MKVLLTQSDRNIGARDVDQNLLKVFTKEFEQQNDVKDLLHNPKTKLKFLEEIEKARLKLTSNDDIDISIDSLAADCDFERTIDRTELESINKDVKEGIINLLRESLAELGGTVTIDKIEMVGEATRMPFVQSAVEAVFKGKTVQRTLNT